MEERQVTMDGVTHRMPEPFLVLATQNPIEYEGTFPLLETQLDRIPLEQEVTLVHPGKWPRLGLEVHLQSDLEERGIENRGLPVPSGTAILDRGFTVSAKGAFSGRPLNPGGP